MQPTKWCERYTGRALGLPLWGTVALCLADPLESAAVPRKGKCVWLQAEGHSLLTGPLSHAASLFSH